MIECLEFHVHLMAVAYLVTPLQVRWKLHALPGRFEVPRGFCSSGPSTKEVITFKYTNYRMVTNLGFNGLWGCHGGL